ncbi:MAG: Small-conductance mechanosensitive ion channel-like protein [Candidatus Collierbacteria bacterium GW2011_GWB1_45_35]|uniref:Small-conductance mechanosensitive ion channel-like protein n=2 Tax=Candidatus Collieribacteriota TaxID=1752725 RepID=A0A0G1KMJ2_9BACT|nr:MAG: Small-conductance mechanosensitive ion channel-like protein [Microgenomates group bacterium GW2011_GWC1_44_23]KKT84700.1 MAG: Small-conductance mechanosensitive ion channel-like protein [Candidatus Collierbacteria bacterium GW2011_GWA2_44_99]KKT96215.1 MAG: Small-conductance mechanosensitive ion channel-like protein [Candidatus Collierbacteria bacterium GW2011_GWA1_45_15]KKU01255.1 MAG: Small-conductance mechanosensitive ion channel-like protein [Candidatus Collierbacteria bacterium GW20
MQTNVVSSLENSLTFAGNQFLVGIISILPSIFGALILFLLGWILADWLKILTTKIVNITKLGSLFKNPAVTDFLKNAQVSQKIEVIIGEVVKWLVVALFFVASINILGITSISFFLNSIIAGIPTLIAAIITLAIGVVVAGFLEKIMKGSLGSSDPSTSRLVSKVVSYAVMTFFVLSALSQLGIASFFINTVFIGFIFALALALGIGLGLGSKDLIKTLLETWYKKIEK